MKTKSTTTSNSVYRNRNAQIAAIFERAGDARKVLCVALDYAKSKHLALVCDGNGDTLKDSFSVRNDPDGVAFLIDQVRATARRRKIPDEQIYFGGEDEPRYVSNFSRALRDAGFQVFSVNAWLARKNRAGAMASTDKIDVGGIATTLLSRRARTPRSAHEQVGCYQHLRELMRTRRKMVRDKTAATNRIHTRADELFPGFLSASASIITPFTPVSVELMKERFSCTEFARRKPDSLTRLLRRHRVQDAEQKAADLIAMARGCLAPDPARIPMLQQALAPELELHQCLARNAQSLEIEAARLLATTPYVMLTSIPGIRFVLAAGLAAELGEPHELAKLDSLCAYAGIVPRTYQSGGEDSPAVQGSVSPRCNRILKDWVVQSAQKLSLYGPPEIKQRIVRWNANGQHGIFAAARRHLRLTRTLVKNSTPFLPAPGRNAPPGEAHHHDALLQTWSVLQNKWRTIPGGLELICDENHPLGFWRRVMIEAHGACLPSKM